MRIISRKALREHWEMPERADSEEPLKAWYRQVSAADWGTPANVKADYRNASILKNSRVCFNIAGNKYRVIVRINYPHRVVYIRFVGTHGEYDQVDADTV